MEDLSRQHRWQEEDIKAKASVVDLHDLEANYTGTKAIVLSTAVDVARLQRSVSAQTPTTSVPRRFIREDGKWTKDSDLCDRHYLEVYIRSYIELRDSRMISKEGLQWKTSTAPSNNSPASRTRSTSPTRPTLTRGLTRCRASWQNNPPNVRWCRFSIIQKSPLRKL
jgi:hypothetical protein